MSFSFRPWVWYSAAGAVALLVVILGGLDSDGTDRANGKESARSGTEAAMFGGSLSRNMVNTVDRNISLDFATRPKGKEKNVKWSIALGDTSYGGPVIAGGRVFVGTNNARPRDRKIRGDRGVVMCFRESDGKFLWQIVHEKLEEANDFPKLGVISTPCVDGDRLYYVSNRCEMVCADVKGDEKTGKGKIIWKYDIIKRLGVFPGQASSSCPLVIGDLVYALTSNGREAQTGKLPKPKAPAFVAISKKTGKLAWSDNRPGAKVMRGQWSNPAAAKVNGKWQVIYAGGDGYLYGLDAKTGDLIWKFDCNPKKATPYKIGGSGQKGFIIATPVVHDGKCYVGIGQEAENDGLGVGHLWCVDITKKPKNKDKDLSPVNDNFDPKAKVNKDSGLVWHYGGMKPGKVKDDEREYYFGRTLSTVSVHDGLVFAGEYAGFLHCLDAKTGKKHWEVDTQETSWCSPYYVDGKVFFGTDVGDIYVFHAGKKLKQLKKITVGPTVKVPPVVAGGVLYINVNSYLHAVAPKK